MVESGCCGSIDSRVSFMVGLQGDEGEEGRQEIDGLMRSWVPKRWRKSALCFFFPILDNLKRLREFMWLRSHPH